MTRPEVEDLLSFDRDVSRGAVALAQWRDALARDPDPHADADPLEAVRHVAGKSASEALGRLAPSVADAPLRDALMPWVYALTQARIGRANEVARARAAATPAGRFAGGRPRLVTWREAWRGVAGSRSRDEAQLWIDAAADAAPELGVIARASAEKRVEVARRLGAQHVWSPLVAVDIAVLRSLASRLLDATEELSRAVWGDMLRDGIGMAAVLCASVAREADRGWPGRLTPRWLEETFPAARGLRVDLPPLPMAFGASSFMRALYAFGFAVRVGFAPASMPYALTREPGFVSAHRLGFVFGALSCDPEWHVHALGLGRRSALAQVRVLARTALLHARMHAARFLLGDDSALAPRDLFDELGTRLFGAALAPSFRGAWPAARDDEPARLLALLESRSHALDLRDRFDADWFRNPRAWNHLRAIAAGPVREAVQVEVLAPSVDALARAFEALLG